MEAKQNDPECVIIDENYPHFDLSFKVIVIGNAFVGKSCLPLRVKQNQFTNPGGTVGVDYFTFNIRIKEKVINLKVLDTSGQEVYRSIISQFYKDTSLAIIVYAINE